MAERRRLAFARRRGNGRDRRNSHHAEDFLLAICSACVPRVLIPRGRPLELVLSLPLWETARAALRLLADDPRPSWAAVTTLGRAFYLPDGSWVLYEVDDAGEQVTVIGAGRRL